jgi:hypothetical protein
MFVKHAANVKAMVGDKEKRNTSVFSFCISVDPHSHLAWPSTNLQLRRLTYVSLKYQDILEPFCPE